MAKFTVDRLTWYRGKESYQSKLLLEDGKRCCIGFVGQQCQVPDESMQGAAEINSLENDLQNVFPDWMTDGRRTPDGNISEISKAYNVNDDNTIGDAEREASLKAIFERNGDEIEFIN